MRAAVGCSLLTIRNWIAERIFHYGTSLLCSLKIFDTIRGGRRRDAELRV